MVAKNKRAPVAPTAPPRSPQAAADDMIAKFDREFLEGLNKEREPGYVPPHGEGAGDVPLEDWDKHLKG